MAVNSVLSPGFALLLRPEAVQHCTQTLNPELILDRLKGNGPTTAEHDALEPEHINYRVDVSPDLIRSPMHLVIRDLGPRRLGYTVEELSQTLRRYTDAFDRYIHQAPG